LPPDYARILPPRVDKKSPSLAPTSGRASTNCGREAYLAALNPLHQPLYKRHFLLSLRMRSPKKLELPNAVNETVTLPPTDHLLTILDLVFFAR
jgi:hypothetical protein